MYDDNWSCKYGQLTGDSRGSYMICPKDCGCSDRKLHKGPDYSPITVMFGIGLVLALSYGIGLLVVALMHLNAVMPLVK